MFTIKNIISPNQQDMTYVLVEFEEKQGSQLISKYPTEILKVGDKIEGYY